jgi:hypothetical protein
MILTLVKASTHCIRGLFDLGIFGTHISSLISLDFIIEASIFARMKFKDRIFTSMQ